MRSTTMTGARGLLKRFDPVSNTMKTIALFSDASFSFTLGTQEIYVLGRFEASEIAITSHELVQVSCRGFRVVDVNGAGLTPYGDIGMASVSTLLNHEDFTIQLEDRQSGKVIAQVVNCRPTSLSEDFPAKGVSSINVSFVGIKLNDETLSNDQNQDPGKPSQYPTAQ